MSDESLDSILEPEVAQPEPAAEAAPDQEPEEPQADPQEQTVPLATFLEVRDEMKGLKRQIAEVQPKPQPAPQVQVPDVLDDQEGFTKVIRSQVDQVALNTRLDMSEMMAVNEYGQDAVDAAFEAAKEAGVTQQFQMSKHAYADMVKWHKSQVAMAEIGGDPDAYRERIKAELREELQKEIQAQQVATQIKAPSLAGETSIGGRNAPVAASFTPLDDLLS